MFLKLIIANSTANHDHSKHSVWFKTSNQEAHLHIQAAFQGCEIIPRCQNMVREWSHVRRILNAYEKTPKKQESYDLSFFKNTKMFLDYFPAPPRNGR